MQNEKNNKGLIIAIVIILTWGVAMSYALGIDISQGNYLLYILLFFLLTHLYTGLFITAHDAIHGVVVPGNKSLNYYIGFFCATLFAFNNYSKLSRKHHLHHKHSATGEDPDYYDGPFIVWYLKFLLEYVTIWQILAMAVSYNILKLWLPMENLILFWMAPAILSTLQLFFFGTYRPHMGHHDSADVHRARSQKINHVWAFLTCYFFGYHHEHHDQPYLAWWQLAEAREQNG